MVASEETCSGRGEGRSAGEESGRRGILRGEVVKVDARAVWVFPQVRVFGVWRDDWGF